MRLYWAFLIMHIKSQMQYKTSFFLVVINQFVATWFTFLSISFMFAKFKHIAGFSYEEVTLCFSVVNFSFSVSKCISEGFNTFPSVISNMEFDRMLTRPRHTILQVLLSRLDFQQLGAILQSVFLLLYSMSISQFAWSVQKILILVLMLSAGICVFLGLSILYASLCFFTIDGLHIINLCITGGQEFGKYPVIIYGRYIFAFFTYVIPVALFQYYPLVHLIDRDTNIIHALLPLCCPFFLLPSMFLWKIGVENYKSVGS